GEVVTAIHDAGALAGIHCCGNTDWSLLMKTGLDLINFDAYDYFTGMTLYPDALKRFLGRGGIIAMGIVPTSDKAMGETVESLEAKLGERVAALAGKTGLDSGELWKQCMVTPSCGTGSLSEDLAEQVFRLIEGMGKGRG
ncbi:MAG: hypothetical protein NT045_04895, partial [Candidatus Aureabacteria bacterium]|nr:hypothetical protein [Candidatus Auribacterota bacterium]